MENLNNLSFISKGLGKCIYPSTQVLQPFKNLFSTLNGIGKQWGYIPPMAALVYYSRSSQPHPNNDPFLYYGYTVTCVFYLDSDLMESSRILTYSSSLINCPFASLTVNWVFPENNLSFEAAHDSHTLYFRLGRCCVSSWFLCHTLW